MSSSLNFVLEDNPPWRRRKVMPFILSNDMSRYVSKCLEKPEKINSDFVMSLDFIHQSNIGEDLGTSTKEETKNLMQQKYTSEIKPEHKKEIETVNNFKALNAIKELHKDMSNTGLITVQQICDIHSILMDGLHHRAGLIRDSDVYTNTSDGERYMYPSHHIVEDVLYYVIDQHNKHMITLRENSSTMSTQDKLEYLIKSAAWLLFNFVDTHPFSDGNGRMCRLLAGYTMMVLNPFPVHPYHKTHSSNCRQDYIDAIITCRRSQHRNPCRLAALLLDALYEGWETVTDTCCIIN